MSLLQVENLGVHFQVEHQVVEAVVEQLEL